MNGKAWKSPERGKTDIKGRQVEYTYQSTKKRGPEEGDPGIKISRLAIGERLYQWQTFRDVKADAEETDVTPKKKSLASLLRSWLPSSIQSQKSCLLYAKEMESHLSAPSVGDLAGASNPSLDALESPSDITNINGMDLTGSDSAIAAKARQDAEMMLRNKDRSGKKSKLDLHDIHFALRKNPHFSPPLGDIILTSNGIDYVERLNDSDGEHKKKMMEIINSTIDTQAIFVRQGEENAAKERIYRETNASLDGALSPWRQEQYCLLPNDSLRPSLPASSHNQVYIIFHKTNETPDGRAIPEVQEKTWNYHPAQNANRCWLIPRTLSPYARSIITRLQMDKASSQKHPPANMNLTDVENIFSQNPHFTPDFSAIHISPSDIQEINRRAAREKNGQYLRIPCPKSDDGVSQSANLYHWITEHTKPEERERLHYREGSDFFISKSAWKHRAIDLNAEPPGQKSVDAEEEAARQRQTWHLLPNLGLDKEAPSNVKALAMEFGGAQKDSADTLDQENNDMRRIERRFLKKKVTSVNQNSSDAQEGSLYREINEQFNGFLPRENPGKTPPEDERGGISQEILDPPTHDIMQVEGAWYACSRTAVLPYCHKLTLSQSALETAQTIQSRQAHPPARSSTQYGR